MANKNIDGDVNVQFTEASSRQTLETGESVKTLFGKLRKWLSDLKPVAFSGSYNDLSNKPTIPDISGKADKSATVSNVTYDTTNKKLTKTINGTTSDVVTTAQLKTDMALSKSDVGLGNVGNFKAVSTVASQGLTDTEKANARTNIGAGTSSFSGSYNDLTNKPNIPNVINNLTSDSTTDALSAKQGKVLKGLVDGNAEITETSDTTPYLYKASEHDAVYDELVGGSVAWNQLIPTTGTSGESSGVTFTNNGDGSWTLNGTSSGTIIARNLNYTANKKNYINNHKYFMYADCDDSNVGIAIVRDVGSAHYAYGKTATIINYAEGSETASWARIQLFTFGYKVTNVVTKPQVFDLTQMFGSTIADYAYNLEQSTAGSGIAWLKSYGFFTKDYYAYNAGDLISANTSGKKVVGKNNVDLSNEHSTSIGNTYTYDNINGEIDVRYSSGYAHQLVLEIPNGDKLSGHQVTFSYKTVTKSSSNVSDWRIFMLTYINGSSETIVGQLYSSSSHSYVTFTIDSNVTEIRLLFRLSQGHHSTASDWVKWTGVQLELGSRATDYEPYTSLTYPIQSTDLRGLYKLDANNKLYTDGDIYSADGTVTRKYGIVDLGTLEWTYAVNSYFRASVPSMKQPINSVAFNAINSKYIVKTWDSWYSNKIDGTCGFDNDGRMYISNSSYTDAATFKTAMSGVYLIYELATPTSTTAQPFTSPQMVYRNGTEEYLDTRDVPLPVGGNRKYVDIPDWMVNEYFDDVRAFDGVREVLDTQQAQIDRAFEQTGYNLLEITQDTQTINGVTFTVDKVEGTITANGTATANVWLEPIKDTEHFYPANVRLTGCPSGGSNTSYYLGLADADGAIPYRDHGNGCDIPVAHIKRVTIGIVAGYTCNNLVFKPMIVPAELAGVPFQPYAMSNMELTQKVEDISDCLYIEAYNAGSAITIQNTSDFTLNLFTKFSASDQIPKFAFLRLSSSGKTYYLRAMINIKSASVGTSINVSFIDEGTTLYIFNWSMQSGTLGTPTITAKTLA